MRDLRHLRASSRRSGRAADKRVLISVATRNSPLAREASTQAKLVSITSLAARLNDACRIVRVERTRVRPVQPVDGSRKRKIAADVPLNTCLIVGEFLRLHLLRDGSQRRELIARARQPGNTVIQVSRHRCPRLENDTRAR